MDTKQKKPRSDAQRGAGTREKEARGDAGKRRTAVKDAPQHKRPVPEKTEKAAAPKKAPAQQKKAPAAKRAASVKKESVRRKNAAPVRENVKAAKPAEKKAEALSFPLQFLVR